MEERFVEKFNNPDTFTDITVKCENEEYACHRLVLLSESKVFKAMFSHENMVENQTRCITIPDCKAVHAKLALEMAYGRHLEPTAHVRQVLGVLKFAEKYDMQRVKNEGETVLSHQLPDMSAQSVASVLIYADKHNATLVKKKALDVLLVKLDDSNQNDIFTYICSTEPRNRFLMVDVASAIQMRYMAIKKRYAEHMERRQN